MAHASPARLDGFENAGYVGDISTANSQPALKSCGASDGESPLNEIRVSVDDETLPIFDHSGPESDSSVTFKAARSQTDTGVDFVVAPHKENGVNSSGDSAQNIRSRFKEIENYRRNAMEGQDLRGTEKHGGYNGESNTAEEKVVEEEEKDGHVMLEMSQQSPHSMTAA
ncbi:hypothetical protein ElyMa_004743300 [Elysia marginata]|uniref:Uncharacterized protein n=1 Tax=Elysia marginata TaxID=1093978 RepID=A0AAV4IDD9_9GAST|nr:hypothetical protein ElyMa_004743300 [Elysia marginata]